MFVLACSPQGLILSSGVHPNHLAAEFIKATPASPSSKCTPFHLIVEKSYVAVRVPIGLPACCYIDGIVFAGQFTSDEGNSSRPGRAAGIRHAMIATTRNLAIKV